MVTSDEVTHCRQCGSALPAHAGAGRRRRYCDATCRSAARRRREKRAEHNDVRKGLTSIGRQETIDAMISQQFAIVDTGPVLDAVGQAQRLATAAEQTLRRTVDRARDDGHTWRQIGTVLGISRQAAFQRFGQALDPRSGKPHPPARQGAGDDALRLVHHIAAGRWAEAVTDFDPTVAEGLSPQGLADSWAMVIGLSGALQEIGTPYAVRAGDLTVVNVPLQFEAAGQVARISYDADGRVAGLFFLPESDAS